ncbi:MAG: SCO6745 family protein [Acidimicrobiales bacterium]
MTTSTVDPALTRPALRAIETSFSAGVLVPAVREQLNAIGVEVADVAEVNIVTRCAPMGRVNAEVVWSAFFNPSPAVIRKLIPAVWEKASPETVLATQAEAFSPLLSAAVAPMDRGDVAELAGLARAATEAAIQCDEGRPLFAGLASLPLPADDHMMIWHAAKLLREHRGDGHIAALLVEGLGRVDALVIHAAFDGFPADMLRRSRRWSLDEWSASMDSLRERGWITENDEPTLTPEGRDRRQWIEDRTDALAAAAFRPLGDAGTKRMIELGAAFTEALEAGGLGSTIRRIPLGD